jgi:hypothetical protein
MAIASDSTQIGFAAAGAALTMVYNKPSYEIIEALETTTGNNNRIANQNVPKSESQTDGVVTKVMRNNFENKLSAYPNPTNGMLTINYSINDPSCNEATLQLIEISSGRVVTKKNVPCNSTQTQIDLNEFSSGVYSLSIQSNLNAPMNIRIIKVQ